ncbi:hypothetical protein EOPP23_01585 [Endozoicomonas sp. OPT23]|uniref:hypothetical protein n=1 Tax=Endozoicomonas sp. OPT23 TaxID=2072845 RepID=UPI00129B1B52|nr:hypothetical protein [Endozoicomonas sp. OPT23]MRI31686.1 hypothetical protein [Endozoicomonas sp. OPT23]
MRRVSSDVTLIAILEHKSLFFQLMDYVQHSLNNPSLEFTISDYQKLLAHSVEGLVDKERRRLLDTLGLDNLNQNGLLSYLDRRSGRFRLQQFVLDMLRHLDNKRLRELSSAELNQLLKQLEECERQLSDSSILWLDDDPDYLEMVESAHNTLNEVNSRLQSNVRALKGQAAHLAELVDRQDYSRMERSEQVGFALNEILRIHERHVTPMLQFLDERLDISRPGSSRTLAKNALYGSQSPMALVQKIIKRFYEHRKGEHVTRLQRVQFHILYLGEDVAAIAKSLETYVRYAQQERQRYNRTEELYNRLLDAAREKQQGLLRDFLLKPEHEVFEPSRVFGNFKNFSRTMTSNINWPSEQGTDALDEVLRVRLEKAPKLSPDNLSEPGKPRSEEELLKRTVINRIMKAMESFDYGQKHDDIYQALHDHLQESMPAYRLPNLVDALGFLSSHGKVELVSPPCFQQMVYQGKQLDYRVRSYVPKAGKRQSRQSIENVSVNSSSIRPSEKIYGELAQ